MSVEETNTGGVVEATAVEGPSRARAASQASRVRAAREASLEGAGAVASRVNDSGGILGTESFVNICDMRRRVKIHMILAGCTRVRDQLVSFFIREERILLSICAAL